MLDLQKLDTFRTVANARSFTRAAVELGYSQSTITAHIQALEREVGASLFERCRFSKEIVLTEIGFRTLAYASRLLALEHETSLAIRPHSEPQGTLRICADSALLTDHLPRLLRDYQIRHEQVRFTITCYSDPQTLTSSVLNGTADVAFVLGERIESDRLVAKHLGRERVVMVCSPHHPLANAGSAARGELSRYQAIFRDRTCPSLMAFERAIENAGAWLEGVIEVGSLQAVKRCAVAGVGFGVLPLFAVAAEIAAGDLTLISTPELKMMLDVQMVRNSKAWVSPAVRALWELFPPAVFMSSAA